MPVQTTKSKEHDNIHIYWNRTTDSCMHPSSRSRMHRRCTASGGTCSLRGQVTLSYEGCDCHQYNHMSAWSTFLLCIDLRLARRFSTRTVHMMQCRLSDCLSDCYAGRSAVLVLLQATSLRQGADEVDRGVWVRAGGTSEQCGRRLAHRPAAAEPACVRKLSEQPCCRGCSPGCAAGAHSGPRVQSL